MSHYEALATPRAVRGGFRVSSEAAKELAVCEETVRRRVRDGELAHRWVGKSLRIDIDASRPLAGGER